MDKAMTLKAHRVNADMTQLEVCKELGIGKNTLVNYEKGRTMPDIDMGIKLANLYGTTVDNIKWKKE